MKIEIPDSLIKKGFELLKFNPDGTQYINFCDVDGHSISHNSDYAVARIYSEGGHIKLEFCEEIILTENLFKI